MVALPCALDCSSGIWTQTADQPMPCTCARKKFGAAADRIEACHQKFMLRRRRKTSQRFSRCSASREPLVSDPDAHGSHPTREAATSCGLSICRRLLYLVWLTLCERLTLVGSVPMCGRVQWRTGHWRLLQRVTFPIQVFCGFRPRFGRNQRTTCSRAVWISRKGG